MTAAREVKLVFRVQDDGTVAVLDQAGQKLDQLGQRAERVATQTTGGFSRMQAAIVTLNQAIGLTQTALHALEGAVVRPLQEMERTRALSQMFGVAVRDLSALAPVAKAAEVDIGLLATGLRGLAMTMSEIDRPGNEARNVMRQLGVDLDVLKRATPREQLLLLSDAFARIADGSGKTAAAIEVFKRSGIGLIPLLNQGSAAIKEQIAHAEALGLAYTDEAAAAADDFLDSTERLRDALGSLQREVAVALIPALQGGVQALTEWLAQNRETLATDLAGYFASVATSASNAAGGIKGAADQLGAFASWWKSLPPEAAGAILGAAGGYALGGPAGARVGALGGAVYGAAGRFSMENPHVRDAVDAGVQQYTVAEQMRIWAGRRNEFAFRGGTIVRTAESDDEVARRLGFYRPKVDLAGSYYGGMSTLPADVPPEQLMTAYGGGVPAGMRRPFVYASAVPGADRDGASGVAGGTQAARDAYEGIKRATDELRDAERERLALQQAIRDQAEARAEIERDDARAQLAALEQQGAGLAEIATAEQAVLDRERAVLETRRANLEVQLATAEAMEGTSASTVKLVTEIEQINAELGRMPLAVEQTAESLSVIREDLAATFTDVVRGIGQGTASLEDFLQRAVEGLGARVLERGANDLVDILLGGGSPRSGIVSALFGADAAGRSVQDFAGNWGVEPGQVPTPARSGEFSGVAINAFQGLGIGAAVGGVGSSIAGATGANVRTQEGIQYGSAAGGLAGGVVAGLVYGSAAGPIGMIIGAAVGAILGAILPDLINKPPTRERIATDASRAIMAQGGFPTPLARNGLEGRDLYWIARDAAPGNREATYRDVALWDFVIGPYYKGPPIGQTALNDPRWQGKPLKQWAQEARDAALASPIEQAWRADDYREKAPYFMARVLGLKDEEAPAFVNMVANTAHAGQLPHDVVRRRLRDLADESGMTLFSSLRSLEDQVLGGVFDHTTYQQSLKGMADLWGADSKYLAAGLDLDSLLADPRYYYNVRNRRDMGMPYPEFYNTPVIDADLFAKGTERIIASKEAAKSLDDEARDMRISMLDPRRQLAEYRSRLAAVDTSLGALRVDGLTERESYEYEELLSERAALGRSIFSVGATLGGARGRAAQRTGTDIVRTTGDLYMAWAADPIVADREQANTDATATNTSALTTNTTQISALSQRVAELTATIVATDFGGDGVTAEDIVTLINADPALKATIRQVVSR